MTIKLMGSLKLLVQYDTAICSYLVTEVAEKVTLEIDTTLDQSLVYCMPHHVVIREDRITTKVLSSTHPRTSTTAVPSKTVSTPDPT